MICSFFETFSSGNPCCYSQSLQWSWTRQAHCSIHSLTSCNISIYKLFFSLYINIEVYPWGEYAGLLISTNSNVCLDWFIIVYPLFLKGNKCIQIHSHCCALQMQRQFCRITVHVCPALTGSWQARLKPFAFRCIFMFGYNYLTQSAKLTAVTSKTPLSQFKLNFRTHQAKVFKVSFRYHQPSPLVHTSKYCGQYRLSERKHREAYVFNHSYWK